MTRHRILVVDDNRDSALSMGELLEAAGFDVRVCFDGPSAVETAAAFAPDACLLDINMPGMDGYALARRLRDLFPDRPPLLATMTAHGDYAHLERAADAGFDLQFTKPAEPAEVVEQVRDGIRAGAAFAGPAVEGEGRGSVLRRLLTRLAGLWSKPA